MAEVQLNLACAALLQNTINLKAHGFGKVVDIVNHGAIFIDRRHGIGLSGGSPPP